MSADALKWWTGVKLRKVTSMEPNDYRVMDVLAYQHHMKCERTMNFTKSGLARLCSMDRRSINRCVDRMERNGWISIDYYPKGYARHYSIPRFEDWLVRINSNQDVVF
jgi:hypothetical protein